MRKGLNAKMGKCEKGGGSNKQEYNCSPLLILGEGSGER